MKDRSDYPSHHELYLTPIVIYLIHIVVICSAPFDQTPLTSAFEVYASVRSLFFISLESSNPVSLSVNRKNGSQRSREDRSGSPWHKKSPHKIRMLYPVTAGQRGGYTDMTLFFKVHF